MGTKKRKTRKEGPPAPTLPELVEAVRACGEAVRNDAARTLGTLANATADLDDPKNRNRLTAAAGRMRFTINACTRYVNSLSLLKQFLATQW